MGHENKINTHESTIGPKEPKGQNLISNVEAIFVCC